jgi:hypothetical protein
MRLEYDVEIKIIAYLLLLVNNQSLVQRGKEILLYRLDFSAIFIQFHLIFTGFLMMQGCSINTPLG